MPRGRIKGLSTSALLLGAVLALSGCNTISGTIGGVGKDISAIGNTLTGVANVGCHSPRCGKVQRNCGPRGCREARRVVSECVGRGCGRSNRSPRYERTSSRDRYAYRDRYSSRHHRDCC